MLGFSEKDYFDVYEDEDDDALTSIDVCTEKELLKIYLSKLKRLKSLYLEDFESLKRDIKLDRNKYLDQDEDDRASEQKDVIKYLHSLAEDECSIAHNIISQDALPTCQFDNGNCVNKCLPLTDFCLKHITDDRRQLLFSKCTSDEPCERTALITSVPHRCFLHPSVDLSIIDLLREDERIKA